MMKLQDLRSRLSVKDDAQILPTIQRLQRLSELVEAVDEV